MSLHRKPGYQQGIYPF